MRNIIKYKKGIPLLIGLICLIIPFHAYAWGLTCDFCEGLVDWVINTATDAAAKALGLDREDNCTVPQAENGYCVFCPMFKLIFNASSLMAHKSYALFGDDLAELVLVFLGVSLALIIIKYVSSMGAKDPAGLMNDILKKTFIGIVIYIILSNNYYYVLSLTLTPIFNTLMEYMMPTAEGTCSGSEGLLVAGGIGGGGNQVGGALPDVGISIVCTVQEIERRINMLFEYGEWAFCRGNGPDRLFSILPHPIYIIDGILLYLCGIFFMIAYPWVMADAILQLGVALALLPFAICGYAFGGTKGYFDKVLEWIINSAFVFIFSSLVVYVILVYVGDVLEAAITNNALADPKEIFTDPNKGIAFWGPNMILIIFILSIGWVYLPLVKELAEKFAGGSGVGAAQAIGGKVRGDIENTAEKVGKTAANATADAGKFAARTIKRGGKTAVRLGLVGAVNTFGTSRGGHKSLRLAGMTFTADKDPSGKNVLKRTWVNPFNGRRHVMTSDQFSTTFQEFDKSGNEIKSRTDFKHDFMNKYLVDDNGDVNVGALDKILNSPAALEDPKIKEAIMTQVAKDILKKKGVTIGEYYNSRRIIYNPSEPGKIIVEQIDYNGKVTRYAADIDMTSGRVGVSLYRDRVKKSKQRQIRRRSRLIKMLGHPTGTGYAFRTFTGTVREIKTDPTTGREYYVKTRRRRVLFWKTKTIVVRDSETEFLFDNSMVKIHTKKDHNGIEITDTRYYNRVRNGHTDYRDSNENNKVVNSSGVIASDLDPARGGKPEDALAYGANLYDNLGITPVGIASGEDLMIHTILAENARLKTNRLKTNIFSGSIGGGTPGGGTPGGGTTGGGTPGGGTPGGGTPGGGTPGGGTPGGGTPGGGTPGGGTPGGGTPGGGTPSGGTPGSGTPSGGTPGGGTPGGNNSSKSTNGDELDNFLEDLEKLDDAKKSAEKLIENAESFMFSKYDTLTDEQKKKLSNAISLLRTACGDTDINALSKNIELLEKLYSTLNESLED